MKRQGVNARLLLSLVALMVIAGAGALFAIGGSTGAAGRAQAKAVGFDSEGLLEPVRAAPPLDLRNYLGQRVNIDSYRGKAVLVTFLYTTCPDICPLIASNLRVALNMMGPKEAAKVQIIAVSVDPKVDTPKSVASFLARHEMTGRMQYLIGSAKELGAVWKAWGVGSVQDAEQPQFVNHTGIIYGITGSGDRLTVYSASFQPSQIVHDVPLLAAR